MRPTHVLGDEGPSQVGSTRMIDVHCQEADFGRYVGAAIARCELDAVEDDDFAVHYADAPGVEVPMAVADPPALHPLLQQIALVAQELRHIALDQVELASGNRGA